MKLLNTKVILSAMAIALLATPAFAQQPPRYPSHRAGSQMQYRDPPGNAANVDGNGNAYNVPTAEY